MKKLSVILLSSVLLFSFVSCSADKANVIIDNSGKSRFIDFYTEGEYAYIECELNIYTNKDTTVRLSAVDEDDVKTGLLKSSELTGVSKDGQSEDFVLKKSENTVTVIFRGDYAGIPEISQREIPRFIYVKK